MNKDAPIGVFDSGVGGLTVVRALHNLMPAEHIVYLGDTARVPYGNKSRETVTRFSREVCRFLLKRRVKAIVAACNTASALALPSLQRKLPVPVIGVIQPGARAAARQKQARCIGVIGTLATIRSGAYPRALRKTAPRARILTQPCPLLVPLVEENWLAHPAAALVLAEYLKPMLRKKVDTLVLGCTHYPLLQTSIGKLAGPKVRLVDSASATAQAVCDLLERRDLRRNPGARKGSLDLFFTDLQPQVATLARRFLSVRWHRLAKATLEETRR